MLFRVGGQMSGAGMDNGVGRGNTIVASSGGSCLMLGGCSQALFLPIMQSLYLPGDEFADMVVEPEDALPLPRESGLFGDGGEGTDIEREVVRFLAAFKGVL
ncbi:hypothetical protein E2C01_052663 [Portunus trituberculatus]|uniref:Uncharacterized protein n=1 Tax=Portunus trituberculatus TaxID=210409 RepID=A0A5B7GN38_PORTR|nr:hypothetical protein [Portunus trituberculatus]